MADPSFLTDSWDDLNKWFGNTTNTAGMTPKQANVMQTANTLKTAGTITAIFGGISSAIGSYYSAKTAQYQEESQASSLQFQSGIDAINAASAEMSAQSIEESGKNQVAQYTMQAGQKAASTQVATAARGVDLSSGSAVTQRASDDLVKQIDVLNINANTTRAAWATRTQATNDRNQSLLASTSANNLRTSADSISPFLSATTSLLGSAASVGSQWDYRRKLQLASVPGS